MAQMEQEIQRRLLTLTKQNQHKMEQETGIHSSLTDEDLKELSGASYRGGQERKTKDVINYRILQIFTFCHLHNGSYQK